MTITYHSKIYLIEKEADLNHDAVKQSDIQYGDEVLVFDNWYKIPQTAIQVLTSTNNSCIYSRIYFRRPKET